MSRVTLEVCTCCALSEQHVADAIDRIRAEHGEQVEIVPRKCLDVCLESAAVKLDGEVLLVRPEDVPALEAKVRQAQQQ
jgi:RNase P/RNase MRP subunit p29